MLLSLSSDSAVRRCLRKIKHIKIFRESMIYKCN